MSLESRLAEALIRDHPERAASVLERLGREEAVSVVATSEAGLAAAVVSRLSPTLAGAVLAELEPVRAARVLDALALDVAARLARRLPEDARGRALEHVAPRRERSIRSLLRFPEHTAGALMDPDVLALPETFTASESLARVKETPENVHHEVYVVDAAQKLAGVLTLRELLLAPGTARLADLMVRSPVRLDAGDDRSRIVGHPGWREAGALPVVDDAGAYLGAVRYGTLRELEEELLDGRREDGDVQQALGQLFAAGAGGLLDALTTPGPRRRGEG